MEAALISLIPVSLSLQRSSECLQGDGHNSGEEQGLLKHRRCCSTALLQRAGTADVHVNIPALLLVHHCVISDVNIRQGIYLQITLKRGFLN